MQLAVLDSSVDFSAVGRGGWRWQRERLLSLQPAVVDVPWRCSASSCRHRPGPPHRWPDEKPVRPLVVTLTVLPRGDSHPGRCRPRSPLLEEDNRRAHARRQRRCRHRRRHPPRQPRRGDLEPQRRAAGAAGGPKQPGRLPAAAGGRLPARCESSLPGVGGHRLLRRGPDQLPARPWRMGDRDRPTQARQPQRCQERRAGRHPRRPGSAGP